MSVNYSRFQVDNLKVQKNHDVMMNGNDFHGSVAFGAQLYLGHGIWMKVDEKTLKLVTYIMNQWLVTLACAEKQDEGMLLSLFTNS